MGLPFRWKSQQGNRKLTTDVPTQAFLSLGSNLGDRAALLREALERLQSVGKVTAVSSFYETEPVEFTNQPWFLNCAAGLQTDKTPQQLLRALLNLEREMGRMRVQKKGPRTIDLDILLFGDAVVNTPGLTIPHPALAERRFVLGPLAEIAGEVVHPVLHKTMRGLLDGLPPGQEVRKLL